MEGSKGRLENGTSVPQERVWSEPPSLLEEDEGLGKGQRYESPQRILHSGSKDFGGRRES